MALSVASHILHGLCAPSCDSWWNLWLFTCWTHAFIFLGPFHGSFVSVCPDLFAFIWWLLGTVGHHINNPCLLSSIWSENSLCWAVTEGAVTGSGGSYLCLDRARSPLFSSLLPELGPLLILSMSVFDSQSVGYFFSPCTHVEVFIEIQGMCPETIQSLPYMCGILISCHFSIYFPYALLTCGPLWMRMSVLPFRPNLW